MLFVLHRTIEGISIVVSIAGVIVVLWGTLEALIRFFKTKLAGFSRTNLHKNAVLRHDLGSHLLLGLEIFIAADIINSVASPTWDKIGILAALVGIRTILSYFLGLEMRNDEIEDRP